MVKEINAEEYSEIVNSSNPVVIDFHATGVDHVRYWVQF